LLLFIKQMFVRTILIQRKPTVKQRIVDWSELGSPGIA